MDRPIIKPVPIMGDICLTRKGHDKGRYSCADIGAVKEINKCAFGKQDVKSGDGSDRIRREVTVANGF